MTCIEGKILTDKGFKKGYIIQKDQKDSTLHFGSCSSASSQKAIMVPTFVNAHTHIADSFIRQRQIDLPHDIKRLVAPPRGLKHRLLQNTNNKEILDGMIHGLQELIKEGIFSFVDFRENGINGIHLLQQALESKPMQSIILGRPSQQEISKKEIDEILIESDGIGLSSLVDCKYDDAALISERTKQAKKLFALHVSERIREPIDTILQLQPDFIVHMTQASKNDLFQVKKQHIPIVVCPRSNYFFRMLPNLEKMKEIGNEILFGTDNFMFHTPSILEEIKFINRHFSHLFSMQELLSIPTYRARKALNLIDNYPGSTFPRSWILLDPNNYKITTIIEKVEEG